MKKISSYFLLIILSITLSNCSDDDDNNLNYVSFESTSFDFGVELNGTTTEDIKVYTSNISSSDRAFMIEVDPSSTIDASAYELPPIVTIPANSNVGVIPVTISDINLGETGKTLVLKLESDTDIYTGENITLTAIPQCPLNEVVLTILFDSYPEETTWELYDSNNSVIASGGPYAGETSYKKAFCLENGTYSFTIFDVYEDGINAPGNYKLTYNGEVIASGDAFGAQDSVTFTVSQ